MRIPSVPLKRDSHSDSAAQPKNSRSTKSRGRRRRRSQRTFIVLVCHHSNVSKTLNRHFLANKISDVWPSIVVAKLLFAYFVKLPKPQTRRVKYHIWWYHLVVLCSTWMAFQHVWSKDCTSFLITYNDVQSWLPSYFTSFYSASSPETVRTGRRPQDRCDPGEETTRWGPQWLVLPGQAPGGGPRSPGFRAERQSGQHLQAEQRQVRRLFFIYVWSFTINSLIRAISPSWVLY